MELTRKEEKLTKQEIEFLEDSLKEITCTVDMLEDSTFDLSNCTTGEDYMTILRRLHQVDFLYYLSCTPLELLAQVDFHSKSADSAITDLEAVLRRLNEIKSETKHIKLPKQIYVPNAQGVSFIDLARLNIEHIPLVLLCRLYSLIISIEGTSVEYILDGANCIDAVQHSLKDIPAVKAEFDQALSAVLKHPTKRNICNLGTMMGVLEFSLQSLIEDVDNNNSLNITSWLSGFHEHFSGFSAVKFIIVDYLTVNPVTSFVEVDIKNNNATKRKMLQDEISHYSKFLTEEQLAEIDATYKL
jgi:hypothetical protein